MKTVRSKLPLLSSAALENCRRCRLAGVLRDAKGIAAAAILLAASGNVSAETALQATASCREVVKGLRSDGQIYISPASQFCWGAFGALQTLSRLRNPAISTDVSQLGVCAGEKVTRSQMILVFLKYADNNPAQLDDEFPLIALRALQEAFPCK
jgi:Rap1a immunity proteins